MKTTNYTTGQALALTNKTIAQHPHQKRRLKQLRRWLVRDWMKHGQAVQYAPNRVLNPITEGIRVSPDMLLTDRPELWAAIAAGTVPGYCSASQEHPAVTWLVQVGNVWITTQDELDARDYYEWSLSRSGQETKKDVLEEALTRLKDAEGYSNDMADDPDPYGNAKRLTDNLRLRYNAAK